MHNHDIRYEISEPEVVAETIDGEAIVINLERGVYFSFRGTGLFAWESFSQGASFRDVYDGLASVLPDSSIQIKNDIFSFLNKIVEEGLIRSSQRDQFEDLSETKSMILAPYVAPEFTKYTDMEALLLLDPIHDTDEMGWPHRP
jgi:hypothetical protein